MAKNIVRRIKSAKKKKQDEKRLKEPKQYRPRKKDRNFLKRALTILFRSKVVY